MQGYNCVTRGSSTVSSVAGNTNKLEANCDKNLKMRDSARHSMVTVSSQQQKKNNNFIKIDVRKYLVTGTKNFLNMVPATCQNFKIITQFALVLS